MRLAVPEAAVPVGYLQEKALQIGRSRTQSNIAGIGSEPAAVAKAHDHQSVVYRGQSIGRPYPMLHPLTEIRAHSDMRAEPLNRAHQVFGIVLTFDRYIDSAFAGQTVQFGQR